MTDELTGAVAALDDIDRDKLAVLMGQDVERWPDREALRAALASLGTCRSWHGLGRLTSVERSWLWL
jgi:hypothetical protein